jgi:hypothetical protein
MAENEFTARAGCLTGCSIICGLVVLVLLVLTLLVLDPTGNLAGSVFAFGLGGLFVLAGAGLLFAEFHFHFVALRTTGRVTGYTVDDEGCQFPRVAFVDRDGREVSTTVAVGASWKPFVVGSEVSVLYDPRRPKRARIICLTHLGIFWFASVFFLFAGYCILRIGIDHFP